MGFQPQSAVIDSRALALLSHTPLIPGFWSLGVWVGSPNPRRRPDVGSVNADSLAASLRAQEVSEPTEL